MTSIVSQLAIMTTMNDLELSSSLPLYSPPFPVPDYTCEPAAGERTLDQTPRIRSTPDSIFIRRAGKTTVVLQDQEANATMPTWGRSALIRGEILFGSNQNVTRVRLRIEGRLDTWSPQCGRNATILVDNTYNLWSQECQDERCPQQLPFEAQLPTHFKHGQEEVVLPPTDNINITNVPEMQIRSYYSIQVLITRVRSPKLGFLSKTKRIFIPFNHYPRVRPPQPIVPSPCFFSAVKISPEEWYQAIAVMKTPSKVELESIHTHLFIPSSRIYGIRDKIPFHVQVTGPEDSLYNFLLSNPTSEKLTPCRSVDSTLTVASTSSNHRSSKSMKPGTKFKATEAKKKSTPQGTKQTLRVFLLRQVTVRSSCCTEELTTWRNQILGQAKIEAVSPLLSRTGGEAHFDWDGELQIIDDIHVGGWNAANVRIKDFIALSITPQNEVYTMPMYGLQLTVPIKLVTESYVLQGGQDVPVSVI